MSAINSGLLDSATMPELYALVTNTIRKERKDDADAPFCVRRVAAHSKQMSSLYLEILVDQRSGHVLRENIQRQNALML